MVEHMHNEFRTVPGLQINHETHHELPALHELLIDDFTSIILSSLDMYGLLDDGIRPAPESPSRPILSCYLSDQHSS